MQLRTPPRRLLAPGLRRGLLCLALIAGVLFGLARRGASLGSDPLPAFSFHSPFHVEQCGRAVGLAQKQLEHAPAEGRTNMLLAEGLLCAGLQDDPAALDASIRLLRRIVRREPASFFAQLDLADALRKRFPLSDEALRALRHAQDKAKGADLGDARDRLAAYMSENEAATVAHRRDHLSLLAPGNVPSPASWSQEDLARLPSLWSQRGPAGLLAAIRALNAFAAAHPSELRTGYHRAEVLYGRISPARAQVLYAAAHDALCQSLSDRTEPAECAVIRLRLGRLQQQPSRAAPSAQFRVRNHLQRSSAKEASR